MKFIFIAIFFLSVNYSYAITPYVINESDEEYITSMEITHILSEYSSINQVVTLSYFEKEKYLYIRKYISENPDRRFLNSLIVTYGNEKISKEDYPYIKKWFTTALENDKYETLIALRRIYKDDMYFHDKNVEQYLKNLYQEALKTQ